MRIQPRLAISAIYLQADADRIDALVYALTELMPKTAGEPSNYAADAKRARGLLRPSF